jgi:ribosomal protein S3AE
LEKAQAMGMNDYVSKPVDEQLYSKIIKVSKPIGKLSFMKTNILSHPKHFELYTGLFWTTI